MNWYFRLVGIITYSIVTGLAGYSLIFPGWWYGLIPVLFMCLLLDKIFFN